MGATVTYLTGICATNAALKETSNQTFVVVQRDVLQNDKFWKDQQEIPSNWQQRGKNNTGNIIVALIKRD